MAPPAKSAPAPPKKAGSGKKAAASSKELPIAFAQHITLEDGTQVPVKIPPGMPAAQAAGIIEFLKANPAAAKAAWQQAQSIMQNRSLTDAFLNMQSQSDPTKSAAVYEALKDDPELAHVFEDVKANGPSALQKHWDDTELMSKISGKLRDMQVNSSSSSEQQAASEGAANNKAGKKPGKPPSAAIDSLHEAAKWGDAEAAQRLLDLGADVNQLNERGISALGVAVGFNQRALVELLLAAGADINARDGGGNTVLHYAAGYGRMELTQLLLAKGADADAANAKQQKAADVAKLNGEKHIVSFLKKAAAGEAAA